MVYSLLYRRPSHHSLTQASLSGEEKQNSINDSLRSGSSSSSLGIPEALSFDRIISNGTCPPCTLRDFMNYMVYIEHDAENLQFFLWYRDYARRFAELPASERSLSPVWSATQVDADVTAVHAPTSTTRQSIFADTSFAAPPAATVHEMEAYWDDASSQKSLSPISTNSASVAGQRQHAARAATAYESAGFDLPAFTIQPFRSEVTRIVSIYLSPSGPRQLNLSQRERASVLHALQNTTHPSAFRAALTSVEFVLRKQSHPNFVRWSICNGNRARKIFGRGLGVFLICAAVVASIIITLSSLGRGWRVIPLAGYVLGIATLMAAWKGMCVVLHGMHHRHLRPWELFEDDAEVSEKGSRESLGSSGGNSFESEPWVARYEKRNVVRKVFDREIWIQEPALRQIQDTIFLQSVAVGLIIGGVVTGVFCAVPGGHFF